MDQHNEKVKESIYIKCSYEDLIINFEDIEENKDLYKKIKHINLGFDKTQERTREILKGSIEENLYSEKSIGNLRVNVSSGFDEEWSSIDSHIFVNENEFEYLKRCVHENIKIEKIYLTISSGLTDEVLDEIFFWSQKSYLSREWKLSPKTNNILPIFGYQLQTNREVEIKRDEYDLETEKEELENTMRNNLKEDINEVLHQNIIFQHHTKQFYEITSEIEKLNKKLTTFIVVFMIFLLILKFI